MIWRSGTRKNYRIWFLPTSGISSCGISQGKTISVNSDLCYRFFGPRILNTLFFWLTQFWLVLVLRLAQASSLVLVHKWLLKCTVFVCESSGASRFSANLWKSNPRFWNFDGETSILITICTIFWRIGFVWSGKKKIWN